MTELQGAVGLAQLTKLDAIVTGQRDSHESLREALASLDGVVVRDQPEGAHPTYDAFVFQVPTSSCANQCRMELQQAGVGTKILPEALTWHFAAHWDHMPELSSQYAGELRHAFRASERHLSRCVALPTSAVGNGPRPEVVRAVVGRVLESQ